MTTGDAPRLAAVTAGTVEAHVRHWHHPQTGAIGRMVGRNLAHQHEVDHDRLPDASGRPKDGHTHDDATPGRPQ